MCSETTKRSCESLYRIPEELWNTKSCFKDPWSDACCALANHATRFFSVDVDSFVGYLLPTSNHAARLFFCWCGCCIIALIYSCTWSFAKKCSVHVLAESTVPVAVRNTILSASHMFRWRLSSDDCVKDWDDQCQGNGDNQGHGTCRDRRHGILKVIVMGGVIILVMLVVTIIFMVVV